MGKLFDYTLFPLLVPIILLWLAAARMLSIVSPFLILPSVILNRRLNAACPFIPYIFRQRGWVVGGLMRLGFEATYCMNVVRRFLTLPLRRQVPAFYLVGFPKAGTTSMAAYLKVHPAISGIDGLTWHEVGGWRLGGWVWLCVSGVAVRADSRRRHCCRRCCWLDFLHRRSYCWTPAATHSRHRRR